MLSTEEKKQKEKFFMDLDRLDDVEFDEAEDPCPTFPRASPKPPPNKSIAIDPILSGPAKGEEATDINQSGSRKRKPSQETLQQEEQVASRPRPPRPLTVPKRNEHQRAPPKPRLVKATSLPGRTSTKSGPPKLKRNFTDLSNIAARMKGEGKPRLNALPKWATKEKPKPIAPDRQLFRGLVFFFVPNNDDDPGTALRIHSTIRHGAQWSHEFCEEVTHIIVTDKSLDATRVAKWFSSGQIPDGPVLVLMKWVTECFQCGYVQDTYWTRFQVAGSKALTPLVHDTHGPATGAHGRGADAEKLSTASESDNEAEHDLGASDEIHISGPGKNTSSMGDALEAAIADVRGGAALPESFDSFDDSDESDDGDSQRPTDALSSSSSSRLSGVTTSNNNAGYLCMESHDGTKQQTPNADTIEKLQEMATMYDQTCEQWRARAFRQAIGKLRRHDQLVRTSQDARNIGLGMSVAAQVEEIVKTGRYKRLEYAQNDPRTQIVKLFMGVYGAGKKTADEWIAQGFRSLDDLRQRAKLAAHQKIGLDHYDDFLQRIPRKEVEEHAAVVENALKAAEPKLQLIIGGSYRRGAKDSGDIDCIIYMQDADIVHIRTLMLDTVIPDLMAQGFLKAGLATGHSSSDTSSKWHGASALPGSAVWRRIDFLFVPWAEFGAAVLYFTGNDLFNRSMRYLAGKNGMRLNQHGLCKDVMRGPKRQRINDGTMVEGHDERRIFEILGVPYRPPEERNV